MQRIVHGCRRIADAPAFNLGMFGVIVANAVVLGLETYDTVDDRHHGLLSGLDHTFLTIFVVELVIRITAFGSRPQGFFRNGWHVFDFVVIAAAFLPGLRENATLLRLARLARIVRVVRLLPDLRILTLAMARSIPGVVSLAVLGVLVLYLYGMVGWLAFGDQHPNQYGDIGDAMLTLFVTLTLENFPDQLELGRAVSPWATLYFISFALIAAFLLFNILIGVVINSMEEAREIEHARDAAAREAHGDHLGDRIEQRIDALRGELEELQADLRDWRRMREQ